MNNLGLRYFISFILINLLCHCGGSSSGGDTGQWITLDQITLYQPSGLTLGCENQKLNLAWDAVNSEATNFQIDRKNTAGNFELLAEVVATENTYSDSPLVNNENHTYRIRLVLKDGNTIKFASEYSAEVTGHASSNCPATTADMPPVDEGL